MAEQEFLPLVWKALADSPKWQHLNTSQTAFDDIERRLSVHAPIIATPGILKMTINLGLRLYNRDDLGMGIH